jgi:integrase
MAATLRRIRLAKGTAPRSKAALLTEDVRRMLGVLPATVLGVRDAALLLIGFAGGFLPWELTALRAEEVEMIENGLRISLRKSTADERGRGDRVVHIPRGDQAETCPMRVYTRWLEVSGIIDGPVFRQVAKGG